MRCYLAMTSCLAGVRDQRAQSQAGVAPAVFLLGLVFGKFAYFLSASYSLSASEQNNSSLPSED